MGKEVSKRFLYFQLQIKSYIEAIRPFRLTAAKTHGTLYVETNKSPAGAGNIDRALQNERGL